MKIKYAIALVGFGCIEGGLFLVYRPLSLIIFGALCLLVAARGGKRA